MKLLGTGFAAGAVYENEGRFVHWFQYEDYMVACAANEDFQISVREAGREEGQSMKLSSCSQREATI